ncbi:hypothetical protein HDU87_001150 [Geranomyces variabilis]|uniref:RNase H type-1 domain-containing protein n=1 Tax=Geranomyces variabilis TaxID=109894 RepID=A0AAD5TBG9_9FUNG|nr:hypothetical protein HDU87_001150 [Geranomyces variabilis]
MARSDWNVKNSDAPASQFLRSLTTNPKTAMSPLTRSKAAQSREQNILPCRSIVRNTSISAAAAAFDLLHELPLPAAQPASQSNFKPYAAPLEISKTTLQANPGFVAPDLSFLADVEPNMPKLFRHGEKVFELIPRDTFEAAAPTFEYGQSLRTISGSPEVIKVFTDGGYCSRRTFNELDAQITTIGVYFPNDERMHRAEAVYGTSSRDAEMLAAVRALEVIGSGPDAVVHVDCASVIEYLIADSTNWPCCRPPVTPPDPQHHHRSKPEHLLSNIVRFRKGKTTFRWVRGHDGNNDSGNSNADALCSYTQRRLCEVNMLNGLYGRASGRSFARDHERAYEFCEAMYMTGLEAA